MKQITSADLKNLYLPPKDSHKGHFLIVNESHHPRKPQRSI